MPVGFKVRDCERCGDIFIEDKEEELSRKNRLAKMLCSNCLEEFAKFKIQERIPPLYYIGRDEPIPEKFRYDPQSRATLD